ncbi:MAG TPA: sugar phosphate isomerase/epimerase family protein [Verrucomicrobiae bacterium]|nr:sugar phosphate isomerase/epimerase family protein [Verrucomicrobiae bacterium]
MQTRRSFLQLAALTAAAAPALAIEPFKRPGAPRMRLSLAGYSFRDSFIHGNKKSATDGKRIDMIQFIDYCAEHGCEGAELTSYYFPPDADSEYFLKLRRHAFLRGISISGSAVGNNFAIPKGDKRDAEIASVKKWIRHAATLDAPHIRIFAGAAPKDLSKDEAKKLCVSAVEECAAEAGKHGIFLGLENHGGIVAEPQDLLDMVRAINSPWVGINLDTGNFRTDDPYHDLEMCAPYSVNVQVKSEIQKRGQKKELADLKRLVKILRDANYQGFVALEYEAAEDPWTAVPRLLKELGQALHS